MNRETIQKMFVSKEGFVKKFPIYYRFKKNICNICYVSLVRVSIYRVVTFHLAIIVVCPVFLNSFTKSATKQTEKR